MLMAIYLTTMKIKLKTGDVVTVKSFALRSDDLVKVRLIKRIEKPKDFWGADGWEAQMIYKKDVDKLIKNGVPYEKGTKPVVWIFDYQIVKKIK